MTIDNVLEILEKYKLHIPSNVFYELKADIVNFEEPTTKNDLIDCEYTDCNNCVNHKYCDYEPTIKNNLGVDCISRQAVIDAISANCVWENEYNLTASRIKKAVENLPSVIPQELKCKDCKWWKDSDGAYRRGCGAESICLINTDKVYQGEGYCYLFEPQESEDKWIKTSTEKKC